MKNIIALKKNKIVILDGATGTELQKRGMPAGVCPDLWAVDNPEIMQAIHADYIHSGSDIIYTCTFGANRAKLVEYRYADVSGINMRLARIARKAAGNKAFVAGDIGPTGKFIAPFGDVAFEDAVKIFKEQARALDKAGVDLFVIETMIDIQEARAALIAVKETTKKFCIVTMTFEQSGRTLNGTDPLSALVTLQSLGADAFGINCSQGPGDMLKIFETLKPYAKIPLVAKPNAGMPKVQSGRTVYDLSPENFSSACLNLAKAGCGFIGGCCGTNPDHIAALKARLSGVKPAAVSPIVASAVSSARKTIAVSLKDRSFLIGECINPTGKKQLRDELKAGSMSLARTLARRQEAAGADLIDVNVGAHGVDEAAILQKAVLSISADIAAPLVIDSADPDAVGRVLRVYPGRAVLNSISCEKEKMKKLLPLAAKYGSIVVLLPITDSGLPKTFKARKPVIQKLLDECARFAISRDDVIVDGLALSVSQDREAPGETLKTIEWCTKTAGVNTVIGLSNVSYGLPNREILNSAFLSMAISRGLRFVIANPLSDALLAAKRSSDVLSGNDKNASVFIARYGEIASVKNGPQVNKTSSDSVIYTSIVDGDSDCVVDHLKSALKNKMPAGDIVEKHILPALDIVGKKFESKEYFLPQLISSAQTAETAFKFLRPLLNKTPESAGSRTVIVLATVKGDIHDIGKNIISLMLKNHGFSVIDLGKDVSPSRIIAEVKKKNAAIVGLSSLMTTTMINMDEVITLARKSGLKCRFILGGAVVTEDFAKSLGALYAKDGVSAVKLLKRLSVK